MKKEDRLKHLMNFKMWFGKYRDKTFGEIYFIQKDWLEWFSRQYHTPMTKAREAVAEFLEIMDETKPKVLELLMEIQKVKKGDQVSLPVICQEHQIEIIA